MSFVGKVVGSVCLGSILLCWCGLSLAADWTLYYEGGEEMHYYDKSSIVRPRKGIVQVSLRTTFSGSQEGRIRRVEMSCSNRMYRDLSDKIDPVTGQLIPEGAGEGYKWTWFPSVSRMDALYDNLCE